jgi:preprotein translocase subunit SecA
MVIAAVSNIFRKIFGTRNDRLVKKYNARVAAINAFEPQVRKLTDAQLKEKTADFIERIKKGTHIDEVRAEALAVAREAMDRSVGIRNIFNPAHAFDPSKLPAAAQAMYAEVQAKIAATQARPEIGCVDLVPAWHLVDIPVELYEAVRELYPKSRPPFRARPFDVQLIGGMVLSEGRIAEMKTGEGKTIVGPLGCFQACLEGLQCHVVTVNAIAIGSFRFTFIWA